MNFRTDINIDKQEFSINHSQKILMLGSCFSDNIGAKLIEHKFQSLVNPFGVLYNPLSVATHINNVIENKAPQSSEIHNHKGLNYHFLYHSSFSSIDKDSCFHCVQNAFNCVKNEISNLDVLIITWGTAYIYRRLDNGELVANCHKLPAKEFSREILSVDQIVSVYNELINKLKSIRPNLKIIFTVSPVRHLKDGFVQNQRSKARLLLAVEQLQSCFSNVLYFPSYEIVMDDLRDYRFFNTDMTHPSNEAIQYIWEKFSDAFFIKDTKVINKEVLKLSRAYSHKLFFPESDEAKKFAKANLKLIDHLHQLNQNIDTSEELKYFQSLL